MSDLRSFNLPDLGEGLTEGEILRWLVREGETVGLNQPMVEVETAKAAVEIPSPFAGVVTTLHHQEGDTVDVGSPIITVDTAAAGADAGAESGSSGPAEAVNIAFGAAAGVAREPGLAGSPAPKAGQEEKISVLVGSGPKSGKLTRRPRRTASSPLPEPPAARQAQQVQPARVSAAAIGARVAEQAAEVHVLAKPPVRKLARDLGVDLHGLRGSGSGGVITRDDVSAAAGRVGENGVATHPAGRAGEQPAVEDVRPDERIAIRGVRKATAAAMVASAFTAPHVTEFVTVDVTPMTELVARLRDMPELSDVKVGPLLVVAKALLAACRRHPLVNASWDEAAGEIVVHGQVNLGIAAATERGLVVPNVKAADRLSLAGLARALDELVETARAGRTAPADMQHGTITITNVGVFGVDTGTPILNPGEAVILCFGAVRDMPWVHEGQLAIRKVTQLALSFDHRLIDGALGSQVLADVAASLADPTRLLL